MTSRFSRILLAGCFLALASPSVSVSAESRPDTPPATDGMQENGMAPPAEPERNNMVMGCWGDADKGDSADLKLHFIGNGALVQYDENKTEKNKRTFGAWEMKPGSTFLIIYWPAGNVTSYTVKRIGPILHFTGMAGASNFTLREIPPENCWSPEI